MIDESKLEIGTIRLEIDLYTDDRPTAGKEKGD